MNSNDTMRNVTFIEKRPTGNLTPWIAFGSSPDDYEKWAPHICGICCLKMVGDTLHYTNHLTLFELTAMAVREGAFTIGPDNEIAGIFHYPFAKIATQLGLYAAVHRKLDEQLILRELRNGRFVVLSVDLQQVNPSLVGSHLIVVHQYSQERNRFILHDCSSCLAAFGENVAIDRDCLRRISNHKGVVLGASAPPKMGL